MVGMSWYQGLEGLGLALSARHTDHQPTQIFVCFAQQGAAISPGHQGGVLVI